MVVFITPDMLLARQAAPRTRVTGPGNSFYYMRNGCLV